MVFPKRVPLLVVQQNVWPLLPHVVHGLLRRPPVLRHEVAADQGGAAGAARLAVHVRTVGKKAERGEEALTNRAAAAPPRAHSTRI